MTKKEYIEMIRTYERVRTRIAHHDLIASLFNTKSKEEKLDQYEPTKLC